MIRLFLAVAAYSFAMGCVAVLDGRPVATAVWLVAVSLMWRAASWWAREEALSDE